MGYHADTCASIILLVSQKYTDGNLQGLEAEVRKVPKKRYQKSKFTTIYCMFYMHMIHAVNKFAPKEIFQGTQEPSGCIKPG